MNNNNNGEVITMRKLSPFLENLQTINNHNLA